MKKLSLVVALLFALSVPAVTSAQGGGGHKAAAKHCKTLRAEMGAAAFREAFAGKSGKRAMKRCVAAQTKARKAAKRRAKKACRAEGERGRALKRCVRDKLAIADDDEAADDGEKAEDDESGDEEPDDESGDEESGDDEVADEPEPDSV